MSLIQDPYLKTYKKFLSFYIDNLRVDVREIKSALAPYHVEGLYLMANFNDGAFVLNHTL